MSLPIPRLQTLSGAFRRAEVTLSDPGSSSDPDSDSGAGRGSGSGQDERLMTPQFWVLMLVTALYFGATGALNALIPPYVVDQLGGTEATVGFVMGSTALTALLARPWFGRLADQRGSSRLMVIGALLSALSLVLLLVSTTVGATVAFRLIIGAGGAAMMTGSALRAIEMAPEGRQSQSASYMLISVHVGLGSGPILGEWLLSTGGYSTVWLVIGGAKVLSAVAAARLDPLQPDGDGEPAPLINRNALLPGVVTLFGVFAFNGFITFVPLYGREVGLDDVGLVFALASLTIILVRVTLSRVPDIIGPIKAGSGALVVTVFAACLIATWPTPTGVFVGAALLAMGLSLQSPSFIPLAVNGVPDRERGSAIATFTGFYDIANAVVGPLLGLIVAGFGYQPAFLVTAGAAVVSLMILNLVVGPRYSHR